MVASFLLGACSSSAHRERADRQVYSIVASKQREALGASTGFTAEPPQATLGDKLRDPAQPKREPIELRLVDCLRIAAENSRDYQAEKEGVYLAALDLTLARHDYEVRFFGVFTGEGTFDENEDFSGSLGSSLGFTKRLATGGQIVLTAASRVFQFFSGAARRDTSTVLDLAITQPLLRGAWPSIAQEPLTQAERNVIYAVRAFERAKHEIAVQVATDYYQLLQQLDQVKNERTNYESLRQALERTQALSEAGRLPEFQVDQARQDELRARTRVLQAQESYEQALDRFRILLGLPVEAPLLPLRAELTQLEKRGLRHPDLTAEAAVKTAEERRLDLRNTADRVADAERRVGVAENAFLPGLDVAVSASTPTEDARLTSLQFHRTEYNFGATLDLPFDRLAERNAYRASLIALEQRQRDLEAFRDSVARDVRQAVRRLGQAKENYDIQRDALRLAERRIESTTLFLQAGRAETRDLLEAQEALVTAQNAVTRALVDHTVARLELLRDMGTLQVDEKGLQYDDELTAAGK